MLQPSDVEHLRRPVDFFAHINQSVDGATKSNSCSMQGSALPNWRVLRKLYGERRSEELERFTKTMSDHGVPESQTYLDGEVAREMLLGRLPAAIHSELSDDTTFCLLPIGCSAAQKTCSRPCALEAHTRRLWPEQPRVLITAAKYSGPSDHMGV